MKTQIVLEKEKSAVQKTVKALKAGGIIVYPTETSYGIGCNAQNKRAIKVVHIIKKEPKNKPLIVLAADLKTAKKTGKFSKTDELLVKKFMPGALTLVVDKKKGKGTIAFRISSHPFAQKICEKFGNPVVSTSANIHGKKPLFSFKKVLQEFDEKVDLIVNAGTLPKRAASTIYDSKNKKILRKGKIKLENILKIEDVA